jgi:hypothetical protein
MYTGFCVFCFKRGSFDPDTPAVHPRFHCFGLVFLEERLELKSLKGQTKAEEERQHLPELQRSSAP